MTDSPPPAPAIPGQRVACMDPDEFFRLVRQLSNSIWVRYYMMERPGEMVLEAAQPAHQHSENRDRLDLDLREKGFVRLPNNGYSGWMLRRWTVKRSDWPPPGGLNCGVNLRTGKGECSCGRCTP